MRINNKLFAAIAACFFLAGSYSHALAVINVTPRITLTPSVTIREEYNDNIFLSSSNEVEDYITTVNPALSLSYTASMLTLSLDYGLAFRFYARHPDLNETSPTQAQRAKLDTTISPYRDIFFVKVFDEYQRVTIDQRRQVSLDNYFVNLTDSNRLLVNPYLEYPLSGTLKTRAGYSYENVWYRSAEGDNAENHTATAGLTKEISSQLYTTLSYSYLFHRPSKTEAYDVQTVSLGMGYQPSPKLSLNGSVGETFFNYGKNERRNNASTVWQVQANYFLISTVTLGAGYSESFSDSVNQGTYKNKSATGTVNYSGKIPLSINAFRNVATYTSVDREDRSIGGTIGTRLPVTANISANLSGTYTNFEFLPGNERVNRYGAQVGIDYILKITTLSFGYTWNLNDSSTDARDYRNNIVFVQAKFSL